MTLKTWGLLALTSVALSAHAQGPLNPLPVSVSLFPVSSAAQPSFGLNLGVADWDLSFGLPKLRALPGSGNFSLSSNLVQAALDRSHDENHRNPLIGSLGASWKFSPTSRLGVNYRIDASGLPDAALARSLGVSYGYEFSSGLRVSTNLDRGLSDSAPRWGGGLSLSYSR